MFTKISKLFSNFDKLFYLFTEFKECLLKILSFYNKKCNYVSEVLYMKRNTLFLLPVCFLLFTSCNNTGPQRQPLGKPVITVNAQKNGITWDAVEDAVSYKVTVNSEAPQTVTTPGYAFSTAEGNYTVSVVAVADDEKYNSEASSYAYSTSKTSVGELSIEGAVITWASYTGMGLEVKFGDNGVYADVTGESYTATETGTYIFHAKPGFNESTKVFYVDGENSTKSIDADLRGTLQAPVLALNTEKNGIVWEADAQAVGYKVQVDENEPEVINTTSYAFDKTVGQHTIKVIALANPVTHHDSEPASYSYEVKATALGEITNTNGHITWASSVGAGIEYKINGGEFIAVTGTEVVATSSGAYTIKASEGFDETNKVLFVDTDGTVNKRAIVITAAAADALVLEDGSEASSADVKDKYYMETYNNGWKETTNADLRLCNYNNGYTEGNAVCVKFFKNGNAFRYNQSVNFTGGYDTLGITLKGENNANAAFTVTLRVTKTLKVGDADLTGVYAYYKLDNLPQRWTALSVSMNDAGWKIAFGGKDLSFAEVKGALAQAGIKGVEKFSDMLPLFDTVAFQFKCPVDANYSSTYAYIDDFKFSNSAASTGAKTFPVAVEEHYAFESDALNGRLDKNGNNWKLSFKYNGSPLELPVTVSSDGDEVTVESTVTNYDFKAIMESADDGRTLTLKEVTGTVKALLANARAEAYYVVEDFESYADTTALRAAYYADFYNGGSGSVIGGNGWSKMTSTDYMDLESQEDSIRQGSHSARMKYNASNQMRYTSIALTNGSGLPYKKASTLSFWTKGVPGRDNVIKVRAYYSAQVTPSTQTSNCDENTVTIKQDADWTEVTVNLKPAYGYYGFSIMPLKENGAADTDAKKYFFVDDVCVYGSISPWKEHQEAEPEKTVINDFEKYTATGTGYDTSNTDVSKLSGLRADFFCDYYKGGTATENRSPVGGQGWFIMGSTDYMDYAYNSTTNNKSARLKQAAWSLNMRYISMAPVATGMGLAEDTPALGTNFTKMSISIKGGTKRDITIKIFAYYQKTITASNQGSNRSGGDAITIPMNSDWKDYTINLDASKTYYGYAIIVNGVANNNPADYIYIDNICMY